MKILRRFADNAAAGSLANMLRRERFGFFQQLLALVPRPVRILDVGGTENFWRQMGAADGANSLADGQISIVLLNLTAPAVTLAGLASVAGDGCSMPQFSDGEFDIVFSNSVIEHIPNVEGQHRMAEEIRRVGKRYFVQTPNRWFPIEPHFLFPGFQFLTVGQRAWLLQHFHLGWYSKTPDRKEALELVSSIRLLNEREMLKLFPGALIYRERFAGLIKSLIVYGGFGR